MFPNRSVCDHSNGNYFQWEIMGDLPLPVFVVKNVPILMAINAQRNQNIGNCFTHNRHVKRQMGCNSTIVDF